LLLIDDDLSFHSFLADLLGRGRAEVVACASGAESRSQLFTRLLTERS
jgi:CheY-like chemotaxis protein